MASTFTWLDYSEHERRRMLDVVDSQPSLIEPLSVKQNLQRNGWTGKFLIMRMARAKEKQETVAVTIQLPAEIARQYGLEPGQIGQHLLEQAAVEGYRSRKLSRGQVARMLGLDWEETEEFLANQQCDRHYDLEDLEQDRKNLDQILGPA
jgi:predicted HTH domain antitoxin